jgi:molybdopterin converting factor small subunit
LIRVRLLGHIRTSVGVEEVQFPDEELDASLLVDRLRSMCKGGRPGFSVYNTIAMVEDGEAFVPAAAERKIKDGERIVLIPFTHGG